MLEKIGVGKGASVVQRAPAVVSERFTLEFTIPHPQQVAV
jgi:hypothetical protein